MGKDNINMESTGKLGFGLMRLPHKGAGIDIKETSRMVDMFLNAGFTYFDTAYVYSGSEEAIKKALVERYPRDRYTLATKLYVPSAHSERDAREQFYTSLKRTGAEYFDYYLLHALKKGYYRDYEKYHLWEFAAEQKEKGFIRHIGFSFHDSPELLDQILTEHPETEFVQLQINYADWEDSSIASRRNYEVARKHGKWITVMEPIKGGTLANPPDEVKRLFTGYSPKRSYASWAVRFAASLDGILTVLSGMSNVAQMEDNLSYMQGFQPLNDDEQKIIRQAQQLMGNSMVISCTTCHYCTKGCPMQIPIPEIFAAMNKRLGNGLMKEAQKDYQEILSQGAGAADCIGCGQCENACPQHIEIIRELRECATVLG